MIHTGSVQQPGAEAGTRHWYGRTAAGTAAALAELITDQVRPVVILTDAVQDAAALEQLLRFFLPADDGVPILHLPDWETLPYDQFSPLPELVSQRLRTLQALPTLRHGALITPVATLLQRLPPREYLAARALRLEVGESLDLDAFRRGLAQSGYQSVSQVMSHGEFAVRGSLVDLFPMGSEHPLRIDLFDDEIDSIRAFDPESQLTVERVQSVELLPAREFPTDPEAVKAFRRAYREQIEGDPQRSLIYTEVSEGRYPGGIEYYLPLFFPTLATLFDYLPGDALLVRDDELLDAAGGFRAQVDERFEQRRYDLERPLLTPDRLYLSTSELASELGLRDGLITHRHRPTDAAVECLELDAAPLPPLSLRPRAEHPAAALQQHLSGDARVLFVAESAGRRELLLETLHGFGIKPTVTAGWHEFVAADMPIGITVAPIEDGMVAPGVGVSLIPETALLGERVRQDRRPTARADAEFAFRNLAELSAGAPVVHEEHGVGRFLGLNHIEVGGLAQEFLTIEYAQGDKLYVPVADLQLIGRYTGASPDAAPLHRLGSDQWEKARRRAAQRAYDVAAELLDIYARREAREGFAYPVDEHDYRQFAASFEFEETPDQQSAIDAVIADMRSPRPMDRVVCGDVGFGKTEVAMRAAFIAATAGKQVAVLVPTTLLTQQHYQNFLDRFAEWPVKVAFLSRFLSQRDSASVLDELAAGRIDIVVGTHKLLSDRIRFGNLGLVIVDEEHRFGVRHKERLKALRSEVDILTLTATPIPRTLNMALAGIRDLSIIATPPVARHPIKTFVSQWNDVLINEACQRELGRGGQVYLLHNEVETIDKMARRVADLVPNARVHVAHGQMRERDLEKIMRDFYHQRFSILVCSTIIESGIDVPTANTIIINRADRLGLAQLHQLRGRVGRSHHRAYAYLITPPPRALTADARKRLEAIEAMGELGAGFSLATQDLEIRGAGELLGDEQSGQINEIGFGLYSDMLERAVADIRAGRQPQLDRPLDHGTEIDLQIPALLPEDYLPDVQVRLVQYKRIAMAADADELKALKVEMIDRFGLLPQPALNLFEITRLKIEVAARGIRKIEMADTGGRMLFDAQPDIDPDRIISLIQRHPDRFRLDGGERLKFFGDYVDPDTRIADIRRVLDQLFSLQ